MCTTRRHIKVLRTSMTTFDGIYSMNVLHFLFRFLDERDSERISEMQGCLMNPGFLMEEAFDHLFSSRNASAYTKVRYWPEYVNFFLSTYATTTAIRNEM